MLDELIETIARLFERGLIIPDNRDLIIVRLPDGRYQIKLK